MFFCNRIIVDNPREVILKHYRYAAMQGYVDAQINLSVYLMDVAKSNKEFLEGHYWAEQARRNTGTTEAEDLLSVDGSVVHEIGVDPNYRSLNEEIQMYRQRAENAKKVLGNSELSEFVENVDAKCESMERDTRERFQIRLKETDALRESALEQEYKNQHERITQVAGDRSKSRGKRMGGLLDQVGVYKPASGANLARAINKIGKLYDSNPNELHIFKRYYKDICRVIKDATDKLSDCTAQEAVELLQGISKLHIACEHEAVEAFMHAFEKNFSKQFKSMPYKTTLLALQAMRRFGYRTPCQKIIRDLLQPCQDAIPDMTPNQRGEVLFSIVTLHADLCFSKKDKYRCPKSWKTLITKLLAEEIGGVTLWQSIRYLHRYLKKWNLPNIKTLYKEHAYLAPETGEPKISKLQREVTNFLRRYFPEIQVEEIVNDFPVDIGEKRFLCQVDGPKHNIYVDPNESPVRRTPADYRRDLLIRIGQHRGIIHINSHEWRAANTDIAKYDLMCEKLDGRVKLPEYQPLLSPSLSPSSE